MTDESLLLRVNGYGVGDDSVAYWLRYVGWRNLTSCEYVAVWPVGCWSIGWRNSASCEYVARLEEVW